MARSGRFFVVCIRNAGYEASLETRKIYVALADESAAGHGLIRVIDESGEDYLYPVECFKPLELPPPVRRAVLAAA